MEIESGIKTMTIDTMGTNSVVSEPKYENILCCFFHSTPFLVRKFPLKICQNEVVFSEHDDRSENIAKPNHRNKTTRRVSFKASGPGTAGRQFNNKPQKNLNLAIRATLDDDDDMVDFPNGLNRDGNVSVGFDFVFLFRKTWKKRFSFSFAVSQKPECKNSSTWITCSS